MALVASFQRNRAFTSLWHKSKRRANTFWNVFEKSKSTFTAALSPSLNQNNWNDDAIKSAAQTYTHKIWTVLDLIRIKAFLLKHTTRVRETTCWARDRINGIGSSRRESRKSLFRLFGEISFVRKQTRFDKASPLSLSSVLPKGVSTCDKLSWWTNKIIALWQVKPNTHTHTHTCVLHRKRSYLSSLFFPFLLLGRKCLSLPRTVSATNQSARIDRIGP